MRSAIRGVIFDVDGTLVDSNDAHARSWKKALQEAAIDVPLEHIRRAIGMGGDKLLPEVAGVDSEGALGRQISERRSAIFRTEFLPSLKAFPRARNLCFALRAMGLKLAIASSAQRDELDALLRIAQLTDLMEGATSGSDAQTSKPDPDIVRAALEQLALAPRHVVMIGDTPYDVEAASRAGLACIALRCGGRSDADLAGAAAIYDSPEHLLAELASSPLRTGPAEHRDHG
jgi:HAD superfamily hydrolase (TIGR01509 family)